MQSEYDLVCKCNSQGNQLKLRHNAPINVKASSVIKYTNLEHG